MSEPYKSRGFLAPLVIVVIGVNETARLQSRWGDWRRSEHYVKNSSFKEAHRLASTEGSKYLKSLDK